MSLTLTHIGGRTALAQWVNPGSLIESPGSFSKVWGRAPYLFFLKALGIMLVGTLNVPTRYIEWRAAMRTSDYGPLAPSRYVSPGGILSIPHVTSCGSVFCTSNCALVTWGWRVFKLPIPKPRPIKSEATWGRRSVEKLGLVILKSVPRCF